MLGKPTAKKVSGEARWYPAETTARERNPAILSWSKFDVRSQAVAEAKRLIEERERKC